MPKTILLADDSSTIRKIVELTFNGTDIRVETFDSGEAALEYLQRGQPDLILADVVMPAPTGYELCKQVKDSGAETPVVLLSSTFEPYDHDLALECGADGHIVKPFESGLLVTTVRELLEPPPPPAAETIPEEHLSNEADQAAQAVFDETYDELAATEDGQDREAPEASAAAPGTTEEIEDDLDQRLVDAVARAVVQRLSEHVVREIAAEVVPDLAERIIRERIRQLESDEDS